jgi:hypothetical protein
MIDLYNNDTNQLLVLSPKPNCRCLPTPWKRNPKKIKITLSPRQPSTLSPMGKRQITWFRCCARYSAEPAGSRSAGSAGNF